MPERRSVDPLSPARVAQLRAGRFTYSEVGGTAEAGDHPGFHSFLRRVGIPGRTGFEEASEELLRWQVQLRAGLRVAASAERITLGAVAVLGIGFAGFAVRSPVRVAYLIDEPDRHGFAYGTLPGHPESGEESFVLQRDGSGSVTFTLSAFSRPRSWPAKLAGPAGRGVQHVITNRYLRSFG